MSSFLFILGAGAFLSIFTFATHLLIRTVSKKYVTELYYCQVEDTAVVYNLLLRPKKIEFKLDIVDVPDVQGMFTIFKAQNVPLPRSLAQWKADGVTSKGKVHRKKVKRKTNKC